MDVVTRLRVRIGGRREQTCLGSFFVGSRSYVLADDLFLLMRAHTFT